MIITLKSILSLFGFKDFVSLFICYDFFPPFWPGDDILILHENLFIFIKFQKMKLQSQIF